MLGRIYLITNLVDGKKYVGQTVQNGKRRFNTHKRAAFKYQSRLPIHRAIRKYGIDNFKYEILEECDSIHSLNEAESKWISELKTFGSEGYNCTTGGEGFIVSDKTRQKISKARLGMNLSEEWCQAISDSMKGESNPFYGKHHSAETISQIKKTLAGKMAGEKNPFYGKQHSEESKKKLSESLKGKNIGVKAGIKHHNVKLTERAVLEIRSAVQSGVSRKSLAERYGVNRQQIDRIINRQRWSHI
jgi:group I intron endonuclease